METTMFTLGVLSIILAALVAIVVYGIVTVLKLKTETTEIWMQLHENQRDVHLHYDRKLKICNRDVNMIEQTLRNSMNSGFDATERLVRREDADVRSYIDSRIDKLVDVYFDTQKTKRQILKD
jgi:hypothetical protein